MNKTTHDKRSIGELLKHPLANVIIGFLFSTLGTLTFMPALLSLVLRASTRPVANPAAGTRSVEANT